MYIRTCCIRAYVTLYLRVYNLMCIGRQTTHRSTCVHACNYACVNIYVCIYLQAKQRPVQYVTFLHDAFMYSILCHIYIYTYINI